MDVEKIRLPFRVNKPILALGSQTKNRLCFAKDSFAYLSPVHSNLSNLKDFLDFEKYAEYFLKQKPRIIAYDMHPEYQSTKYAFGLNAKRYTLYAIQHHHAHIAACMAENGIKNQKVIGVAFDGTGLGIDNKLWGADLFICDYKEFTRKAHLQEIPLIGGEKAVLEPFRLTSMWLYLIYGERFLKLKIDFVQRLNKRSWALLKNIYQSGISSPLASSMGRLFDAAASLILAQYKVSPLVQIKTTNYLLPQLAYAKAKARGFDEAILLNSYGYIAEASRSNIFLVKKGKVFTPSLECGCLGGITRKLVLDLARKHKIKTYEVIVTPKDLYSADEAFLTNSLMGVMPLASVGKRVISKIGKSKFTELFMREYKWMLKR